MVALLGCLVVASGREVPEEGGGASGVFGGLDGWGLGGFVGGGGAAEGVLVVDLVLA